MSLCYEIHGTGGKYYNLITDECISVNAHYCALSSLFNGIDEIAIRAVDNDGVCRDIWVTLPNCTTLVDNVTVDESYAGRGIHITTLASQVHVVVPNCKGFSLSMWVVCKECANEDANLGRDQFRDEVITFIVTRRLDFGHRKAHGLLGM